MPGPSDGGRLRRTWPQRLLIGFNACVIVVALLMAGSLAYAKRTVSQIRRTTTAPGLLVSPEDLKPGEPENYLVVGVDSDSGLPANDPVRNGRDTGPEATAGLRSDTIMIVRVDPGATTAKILSFPRDLWVDIPGNGSNRINAAIPFGNGKPDLLIQTIKENFDIDVSHYVQVDLAGFKGLVSIIGGVPVYFATPVRDTRSGLNVPTSGCTVLNADGALSYARSRHFYYQNASGKWVSDPTSDLGRITRQQDFVRRVSRRAINQGWRNPTKLVSFVNLGVKNIVLDENTTAQDLIRLGRRFRNYDPESLRTYSLPVTSGFRQGASILDLQEQPAQPILDLFRGVSAGGVTSGAARPADVTVEVLNGTGKTNQAAVTRDQFDAAGFKTVAPSSASAVSQTQIRYLPGHEAEAVLVQRYVAGKPVLIADPQARAGQVQVVTGPDFFAVRTIPLAESAVTTTTTTTAPQLGTTAVGATPVTTTTTVADGVPTTEVRGYLPGPPPAGVSCG